MQIIHVQIFAGVMAAGLVLAGFGAATLHAGKREVDRKLANAEKEIGAARAGGAGSSGGAAPGAAATKGSAGAAKPRDFDRENRDLAERIKTLEARVASLEKENAMLREALQRSQGIPAAPAAAGASAGRPAGGLLAGRTDLGSPGPAPLASSGPAPLPASSAPPPPPAPSDGGIGEQSELGEMAKAMKLVPEQREELRKMWKEYQDDFDRLLTEANNAGTRDMAVFDRIGAQARHNFDQRFNQMLYPEQKPLFLDWKKKRDSAEVPR